jgi:subtilisin inhibitor-like
MGRKASLGALALLVVAGALFAGCGSGENETQEPGGDASGIVLAETDLEITVWPEGKGAGEPQHYTLSCPEPSGDHPDPERACDAIYALDADDFQPVPADAVCTEQYGGPQQARVEGTFASGEDVTQVALDLSRENGCAIGLWDTFAAIVPLSA